MSHKNMRSQRSQTQEGTYSMLSFIRISKKDKINNIMKESWSVVAWGQPGKLTAKGQEENFL